MPPMPLHRPRRIRATSERFPDDEPERERRGLAGCGNENNYKNRRIERVAVSLSVLGLGVGCRLEPPQVSSGLRSFSPAGLKPPCGARALGARIDRWVLRPSRFAFGLPARLARYGGGVVLYGGVAVGPHGSASCPTCQRRGRGGSPDPAHDGARARRCRSAPGRRSARGGYYPGRRACRCTAYGPR